MVSRSLPSPRRTSVVLALFVLGATWLILNNFKRNHIFGYGIHGRTQRSNQNFVSSENFLEQGCNVFEGKWVLDNISYPLYQERECHYLLNYTSCQRTGRPDLLYQNWRWQPERCNLPRFYPLELLNVLRGKKLMFVGDSMARNQFDSLICMIESTIPERKKSFRKVPPSLSVFEMEEYNASIIYYWAPFLVKSISDNAENHTVLERFVYLDSIENVGESWKDVDILVFDTYAWWFFKPTVSATYHGITKEYHFAEAYRLALGTWANWMDNNINPHRQQVYFMTMSPSHRRFRGMSGSDENCFNETLPNPHLDWRTYINIQIMEITKDVLQGAQTKVTFLNVSQLSEYRVDAHPTIYGQLKGKFLTKEQKTNPKNFSDCLHWCLPGVPDTWNEILYSYLLRNHIKSLYERPFNKSQTELE